MRVDLAATAVSRCPGLQAARWSRRGDAEVLFLETGYHFAETIGTRDAVAATLPVDVRTVHPLWTVAEQDADLLPRLHDRDPDRCCGCARSSRSGGRRRRSPRG